MIQNTILYSQNSHLEISGVVSVSGFVNSVSLSKLFNSLIEGIPQHEILYIEKPKASKINKNRTITIYTSTRETALLLFSRFLPWSCGFPMSRTLKLKLRFPDQIERLVDLENMNENLIRGQPPLTFNEGHQQVLCSLKHTITLNQHSHKFIFWMNRIYCSCRVEVPAHEKNELFGMLGNPKRLRGLMGWKILKDKMNFNKIKGIENITVLVRFKVPSQANWFYRLINDDKFQLMHTSISSPKAKISLFKYLEMTYNQKMDDNSSISYKSQSQYTHTLQQTYQQNDEKTISKFEGKNLERNKNMIYPVSKNQKNKYEKSYYLTGMFNKKFSKLRRKQLYLNIERSLGFRMLNRSKVTD